MTSYMTGPADADAFITQQATKDFQQLFDDEWVRLIRILARVTGSRELAEDVVQESFLRYYRQRHAIGNPAGWLYRVAIRLGLDAVRRETRRMHWELAASASEAPPLGADSQLQVTEQRKLVRAVLSSMRSRLAQVLLLRASGLPLAQIAELSGIRVSSVGTLLDRAESDFKRRFTRVSKGARP